MGTRGYRVYRHKGWYFVWFNRSDSYPEHLGLIVLNKVSRDNFEEWLLQARARCQKLLAGAERDEQGEIVSNNQSDFYISNSQPQIDLWIEWIYELDLDHLVFHVDSQPLFRLDHLPPQDKFCDWIEFDSYQVRACAKITPHEYRYNWRVGPPPVEDSQLSTYATFLAQEGGSLQIHDLLFSPEKLTEGEAVRVHLLQAVVGTCMGDWDFARIVRELEATPSRADIQPYVVKIAIDICRAIFDPPILSPVYCIPFMKDRYGPVRSQYWSGFTWLRSDICLRLTTHLDDKRNLQVAVACLVHEISDRSHGIGADVVFGVAFSFFHTVVVRLDKKKGSYVFRHTPALQFLPSFYTSSPCTPGITALGRLAHLEDCGVFRSLAQHMPKVLFGRNLAGNIANNPPAGVGSSVAISAPPRRIPVELWDFIASHMFCAVDLVTLSRVCSGSRAAAARVVRRPLLWPFRLIKPILGATRLTRDSFYARDKDGVLHVVVVGRRSWADKPEGTTFVLIGDVHVSFVDGSPEEVESSESGSE